MRALVQFSSVLAEYLVRVRPMLAYGSLSVEILREKVHLLDGMERTTSILNAAIFDNLVGEAEVWGAFNQCLELPNTF